MKHSNLALTSLLYVSCCNVLSFSYPAYFATSKASSRSSIAFSNVILNPSIQYSRSTCLVPLSVSLNQDFDTSPSPSRKNSKSIVDDKDTTANKETNYVQTLSPEQRRENLNVMTRIFKHDLADLHRRRDYVGWVEAKRDFKRRQNADPWFELNDLLKEAVQLDEKEEVERLKKIIEKVGGPPPGVKLTREYAVLSDIYGSGTMSLSRAESIAKTEQSKRNALVWKRMMAERKANMEAEEEEYWNDPLKDEKDAKRRREKMMGKIYGEIEEKRKTMEARAKEIQEKYREQAEQQKLSSPLERAIAETQKALEQQRIVEGKEQLESVSTPSSAANSENGRPRLPGDNDMTMGEIQGAVYESSDVTTGMVRIEVDSSYNPSQSDPPMRKHCFKYNIKITNLNPTEKIQLTSRKFEIQTVGMSKKDVVQGEGVTGRQPILHPGEVFQYSSTAPLSVRPLGTTIVAARMSGTYFYKVLNHEEQHIVKEAELGTFHFVFPPSQRVQPVDYTDEE